MKLLKPRHSTIRQIVVLEDGYILVESYVHRLADKPLLYKRDLNLNLVWEVPASKLFEYITIMIKGKELKTYDGTGTTTLNPVTGELTNYVLTK